MPQEMIKKCPECGGSDFFYDDYEDMYYCMKCNVHLYPKEVGAKENKNAGIWKED